jgi:hypothetical protein
MGDSLEVMALRTAVTHFKSENDNLKNENKNLKKSLDHVYVVRHGYGVSKTNTFRDFKKAQRFTIDCVNKYLSNMGHNQWDAIPKFRNNVEKLDGFQAGGSKVGIYFLHEFDDPKDTGFVFSKVILE